MRCWGFTGEFLKMKGAFGALIGFGASVVVLFNWFVDKENWSNWIMIDFKTGLLVTFNGTTKSTQLKQVKVITSQIAYQDSLYRKQKHMNRHMVWKWKEIQKLNKLLGTIKDLCQQQLFLSLCYVMSLCHGMVTYRIQSIKQETQLCMIFFGTHFNTDVGIKILTKYQMSCLK